MATQYPRHITLEWLRENKKALYVRNLTRPRGQLGVNFLQPNGRAKLVTIPRTHLPVCLSDQFGWDTIIASDDLRACINRGVLDIVKPEVAERELQSEGAIEETQRMQLSAFSAKQAFVSKRVQDMIETNENKVDPNAPGLEPLGIETDVLQPRVLALVEKLKNKDISIKAALNELKTLETELRESDCSYILANGPDGQIRNYVQKLLAQIRNRGIDSYSIEDDDMPELTDEEKAYESQREAIARQHQQV